MGHWVYYLLFNYMIITLKLLKEKGAYEGFLDYFQSLEKQEWDIVELFDRCVLDGENKIYYSEFLFKHYANFLFKCVDKNNFEKLIDRAIQKDLLLGDAVRYCGGLFTKELCAKAVEYRIQKGWFLDDAYEYCNHLFTKDLFTKAVEYYMEKGWSLHYAFRYCSSLPFFKEVMSECGVKV